VPRTIAELGTSGPSPHLSWKELACRDAARTPYPLAWRKTRAPRLARAFEAIREACGGKPITVTSGYRTWEWNRIMPGGPGAKHTQHPEGTGADMDPPEHMHVLAFHEIIVILVTECPGLIGGIGLYMPRRRGRKGWVHMDVRETGRLARWHGSRPKADS